MAAIVAGLSRFCHAIDTNVCKHAPHMKKNPPQERHLVVSEVRLPEGGEWNPKFRGWCMSYTAGGISYYKEPGGMREIPVGSLVVFPSEAGIFFRASQINEAVITYFCLETEKLLGLLTFREQQLLTRAAGRGSRAVRVFAPGDRAAEAFKNIHADGSSATSGARLRALQVFIDTFDWEGETAAPAVTRWTDSRKRLQQIMNQMSAADFAALSVTELAPMVPCSPRHLNRLLRKELGGPFRQKQIELRLAKACQLLSSSDAKVVDVALESGYQSTSVFSGLFKKHLGLSPGQWRRQGLKTGMAAGPR